MNWKIVETTSGDKKIGLVSELPVFDEYLDLYELGKWKEIIDIAIEESRFGLGQYQEIIYPNYLDGYDIDVVGIIIPEDCVSFRITLTENSGYLVNKNDFHLALLALAERLVETHENNPGLPEGWATEMRQAISLLYEKVR